MSAIAGRVLILPKGDYDASVTYEFLDLVNHNSSSWLAKKASQGIEPSDANSEFWQKFGSSFTVDGETITIDENGVISAVGGTADKVTYENESVADVTNVKEALDKVFEGAVGDYATKTEVGYPTYTPQETFNLLNPTMATTTLTGVTCTNNGDGTYTLNGTATAQTVFALRTNEPISSKKPVKLVGSPDGKSTETYFLYTVEAGTGSNLLFDRGGNNVWNDVFEYNVTTYIVVKSGIVCDNLVFKPMLTTNLDATYDDFVPYGVTASNAGYHNSVYRGKYLGDSVTTEQYEAISSGTFDDLFIGDYWTIDGVNWRIAAFDYCLNTGDTAFVQHHAVIVPDTALYTHVMNDTDTTAGGYVGSKMYTEGLEQAKTIIKTAFNGHVLSHRLLLTNAITNGLPSGGAWYDSEVDLMNEQMVFGSFIYGATSDGVTILSNGRVETSQLPLFFFRHDMISKREYYRLRDACDSIHFSFVGDKCTPGISGARNALGVRPYFCIG